MICSTTLVDNAPHRAWRAAWLAALWCAGSVSAAETLPVHGLIVKLKPSASREVALSANASASAAVVATERLQSLLTTTGVRPAWVSPVGSSAQLLQFERDLSATQVQQITQQLQQHPAVQWVVPNEREQRMRVPSDTFFGDQWWLHSVRGSNENAIRDRLRGVPGFQTAWLQSVGSSTPVIAVLDTGITRHPDLDAHVLPGYDFVSEVDYAQDGDGRDDDATDTGDALSAADKAANPSLFAGCSVDENSWHGTAISGILSAVTDNEQGVAGINWSGRVLPVRVAGRCGATVADIVDAMRWAAGLNVPGTPINPNPARVVNISFGGSAACNAAYQEAIDELTALDVLVVAAAGNEHGAVKRPASCQGVVAVAAVNRDGFKASYSNFGPEITIATVGGDPSSVGAWGPLLGDSGLLTLTNDGLSSVGNPVYLPAAGTSFAAPMVSGVAGLMLSVNPQLTVPQLINGLKLTSRPHVNVLAMTPCSAQNPGRCTCTAQTCGVGLLDAEQAMRYALYPEGYVAPVRPLEQVSTPEIDLAVRLGTDRAADDGGTVALPTTGAQSGGGALNPGWLLGLAFAVWRMRKTLKA